MTAHPGQTDILALLGDVAASPAPAEPVRTHIVRAHERRSVSRNLERTIEPSASRSRSRSRDRSRDRPTSRTPATPYRAPSETAVAAAEWRAGTPERHAFIAREVARFLPVAREILTRDGSVSAPRLRTLLVERGMLTGAEQGRALSFLVLVFHRLGLKPTGARELSATRNSNTVWAPPASTPASTSVSTPEREPRGD